MSIKSKYEECLREVSAMTREEIIEQLENSIKLIKQDGKDYMDDRDIPILETCIEALKKQSIESAKIEKAKSILKGVDDAKEIGTGNRSSIAEVEDYNLSELANKFCWYSFTLYRLKNLLK